MILLDGIDQMGASFDFQTLPSLTAENVMRTPAVCAHPDQTLADLERMLMAAHITGAPVVEHGRMVGVVSRSDIVRVQVLVESLDGEVSDRMQPFDGGGENFQHPIQEAFHGFRQRLTGLKVRDAMRTQVITCSPTTPVGKLASDMVRHHVHRVIVVERDRPVGVVSSIDLVKLLADDL